MRSFFTPRKALVAAAIVTSLSLTACQAPQKQAQAAQQPAATAAGSQTADSRLTQRELAAGLYEMAYSSTAGGLYVASAQGFKTSNGGVIYRLDPKTLETLSETHTDLKNFGVAQDADGSAIYITNTVDGGITKVDAQSGKVLQRLMFKDRSKKGDALGSREILAHDGLLYVGGVGDPGVIWVVDAKTLTLKTTIKNAGKWVTGIIWSPLTNKVYAANGGGEILVINPRTRKIEQRWTAGDDKPYLFLNMAEDPATGRLFVTDNSKAKETLVFDERSGKVIKRLPGDALAVKFNAKRNEIYISQRESKKVLQLDATTYAVKNSWSFDSHPNSLELSPDGQTLYVSVKQALDKSHTAKGPDSVARITLN